MKTLHELSNYFSDKQEKQTKNDGEVPDWWEGITTLSMNAVTQFEKEYKNLQHHKDTTVGLWATDRPDLIPQELKEKLFFQIK